MSHSQLALNLSAAVEAIEDHPEALVADDYELLQNACKSLQVYLPLLAVRFQPIAESQNSESNDVTRWLNEGAPVSYSPDLDFDAESKRESKCIDGRSSALRPVSKSSHRPSADDFGINPITGKSGKE